VAEDKTADIVRDASINRRHGEERSDVAIQRCHCSVACCFFWRLTGLPRFARNELWVRML
jgi:hypothetical protein